MIGENYNTYNRANVVLSDLFKYRMPIFYGTQEDEAKLIESVKLFALLFNNTYVVKHYGTNYTTTVRQFRNEYNTALKQSIAFIQISQGNVKYMKHCTNASHINDFYVKMLYRKQGNVQEYFNSFKFVGKYNGLESIYKNKYFSYVNTEWSHKMVNVKNRMESIQTSYNLIANKVRNESNLLEKYFINQPSNNVVDAKLNTDIDELLKFQSTNSTVLSYISLPSYSLETAKPELINILQKVMKF